MPRFEYWSDELAEALAEPFPPEVHQIKRQGGSEITFVAWPWYTHRLNEMVGPGGWSNTVRMADYGGKLVCVVALSILGVTKENVGDEDEDKDSYGTACTNGFAQALKRTAALFGLGAYLYDKAKRDAAQRGGNGNGRAPQQSSGSGKATQKQLEYLESLMKSSVFTEDERGAVGRKISAGDKVVVSKAIEWCKEQVDARKEGAPA